jgi:hypothetical protein
MASPTTGPYPETRLKTPGGSPASSMMSASAYAARGATSLVQRVVPRRDRADDADGLAHDQGVAAALAGEVVTVEDVEDAAQHGDRRADVDLQRDLVRRAQVGGDERGEVLLTCGDALKNGPQEGGTPGGRGRLPGGEGATCLGHRAVDVGGRARGDPVDGLLGRRIDDVDGLRGRGVGP